MFAGPDAALTLRINPHCRSPKGTYNPDLNANSSLACKKCPLHTTTTSTGTVAESDCVCNTDAERVPLPEPDQAGRHCGCAQGYFYSEATQACSKCADRTTSLAGSTRCDLCDVSFYL